MPPVEYDVFVCCHEPSGSELGGTIASALTRRGFNVLLQSRTPGTEDEARRAAVIDDAPDFVFVLTPDALGAVTGTGDHPVRREVAHALRAQRNVVTVTSPGVARPRADSLPQDLRELEAGQWQRFDPDRISESLALVAHRLSSEATVEERRIMRLASRFFWTAAAAILAILAVEIVPAIYRVATRPDDPKPLPPLALYWAGFGQRLVSGQWTGFDLADGSALAGGDQLKLVFSPSADGHGYVVARDVKGRVIVLFPTAVMKAASRVRAGMLYNAPVETGWYTVEAGAGLEAIYLLASYDPIENIEELVDEPEGSSILESRRMLLETTVAGLLDGRHGFAMRVRTRTGRPIVSSLPVGPSPGNASATLASGATESRPLTTQPGLLTASVEIRVRVQ